MNFHEVSVDEAEELHPFINFEGVVYNVGTRWWNVDPSGVTNAYAIGARLNGAEIYRFTPVIGTEQNSDGTWIIRTERVIFIQSGFNAAGLWGRVAGKRPI